MSIQFDESRGLFLIHTPAMTYAFAIADDRRLIHLHWGGRVTAADFDADIAQLHGLKPAVGTGVAACPCEYAVWDAFDYDEPAMTPVFADGTRGARLVYHSHRINADELTVELRDRFYPLAVELHYRPIGGLDLIARRAVIRNLGGEAITLERMFSATVYLPEKDYRLTHFAGSWGAEYTRNQLPLRQNQIVLENHRTTCAAHQHTPFVALDSGSATETDGEVFYGTLCWSGDFKIIAERNFFGQVRINAGVNDCDARWTLTSDHPFESPEFVLGYTNRGFGGMSKTLYDWQFDFLCPQNKAHAPRPVIYNSWYPYEFAVNEENCMAMAEKAARIGAELFVIDDGWMPKRVNDHAGLGDWTPDPVRFPHGLAPIADACHRAGLLFGLWVEPEMVNPDSDLYRAHPDWVLCDRTRPLTEMRNQLTLNLALDEVRDWCIDWLDRLITDAKLDYLKWDMNRYVSERGTDREMAIRYIQNLYAVWQSLNDRHPNVLFENCASGGGRTDFGMAPYADRINRSDNADSVDVMRLHEGFSTLFLPKLAGGAGNISPCPNGINRRRMPLDFRADCGMNGSMSVGINLLHCSEEELDEIRAKVDAFKAIRADVQDSYVLRLRSVYDGNISALEYLRRNGETSILFLFGHGLRFNEGNFRLRLRGLEADAIYADESGTRFSGAALMNRGIPVNLRGDYDSRVIIFRKIH